MRSSIRAGPSTRLDPTTPTCTIVGDDRRGRTVPRRGDLGGAPDLEGLAREVDRGMGAAPVARGSVLAPHGLEAHEVVAVEADLAADRDRNRAAREEDRHAGALAGARCGAPAVAARSAGGGLLPLRDGARRRIARSRGPWRSGRPGDLRSLDGGRDGGAAAARGHEPEPVDGRQRGRPPYLRGMKESMRFEGLTLTVED